MGNLLALYANFAKLNYRLLVEKLTKEWPKGVNPS